MNSFKEKDCYDFFGQDLEPSDYGSNKIQCDEIGGKQVVSGEVRPLGEREFFPLVRASKFNNRMNSPTNLVCSEDCLQKIVYTKSEVERLRFLACGIAPYVLALDAPQYKIEKEDVENYQFDILVGDEDTTFVTTKKKIFENGSKSDVPLAPVVVFGESIDFALGDDSSGLSERNCEGTSSIFDNDIEFEEVCSWDDANPLSLNSADRSICSLSDSMFCDIPVVESGVSNGIPVVISYPPNEPKLEFSDLSCNLMESIMAIRCQGVTRSSLQIGFEGGHWWRKVNGQDGRDGEWYSLLKEEENFLMQDCLSPQVYRIAYTNYQWKLDRYLAAFKNASVIVNSRDQRCGQHIAFNMLKVTSESFAFGFLICSTSTGCPIAPAMTVIVSDRNSNTANCGVFVKTRVLALKYCELRELFKVFSVVADFGILEGSADSDYLTDQAYGAFKIRMYETFVSGLEWCYRTFTSLASMTPVGVWNALKLISGEPLFVRDSKEVLSYTVARIIKCYTLYGEKSMPKFVSNVDLLNIGKYARRFSSKKFHRNRVEVDYADAVRGTVGYTPNWEKIMGQVNYTHYGD